MTSPPLRSPWRIGEWTADPADDSLSRQGESIKLEPRLMQLLVHLAEAAPRVVSMEELLASVWSGVIVGPASVYQSVSQLRRTLGDTELTPRYIETVARKGYRLVAPASRIEPEPVAALVAGTPADVGGPAPANLRRRVGVVAALLLAFVLAAWQLWPRLFPADVADALVVLPFVDLSADRSEQFFCDGLTEELSSWLAQLPTLRVVARTSAFAFRGTTLDVREIGRRLGATHALEGSVRRVGEELRITVKLIATGTGYQLWTASYDSKLDDVIGVQEQVSKEVATNLSVRLTQATMQRLDARRSDNGAAYRLYLIARHHHQQRSRADNQQAIALYRQAIEQDPKFALAYVWLALAHVNERFFDNRSPQEVEAAAAPLLARAQALEPLLPDLYVVRGALETDLQRPQAALSALRYAVELDPNSRDALAELGFLHLAYGEPRAALESYTQAAALDPIDYNLQAQRCLALQDLGRLDEAGGACERARSLGTQTPWPFSVSAFLAEAQGRLDEALRWNGDAIRRSPDLTENLVQRGIWLFTLGAGDGAREAWQAARRSLAPDSVPTPQLLELEYLVSFASAGATGLQRQITASDLGERGGSEHLFEMADAALLADDPRLARALVDRALSNPALTQAELDYPWTARTGTSMRVIAAAALKLTGEPAQAETHLAAASGLVDRMTTAGVRRQGVEKLRAEIAALRERPDDAMRALASAEALGWAETWEARQRPYFASLRNRADFKALLERIERRADAMRRTVEAAADPPPPR